MGAMFAKAGFAKEEERLILPNTIYYSKLASSNITQLMTETNDQISTNPVWSGKRQVTFSQELFDALEDSKPETRVGGKDCLSLAFDENKELAKVSEIVKAKGNLDMGTVEWKTVAGATTKWREDGANAGMPTLSGVFFLSRE